MRFSIVSTLRVEALDVHPVAVEADVVRGMAHFSIVGLGDRSVSEARDRVSSAIRNSGYVSPKQQNQKVVVSLAPCEVRKIGSGYDLAIALSYLIASGQIPPREPGSAFVGELSLDGTVRSVTGSLALALGAKRLGIQDLFVSDESFDEIHRSRLPVGVRLHRITSLKEAVEHDCSACVVDVQVEFCEEEQNAFDSIVGSNFAKRAALVAAVGAHNVALVGPPGSGKSMLAAAIPPLLPDLSDEELLEVAAIRSISGHRDAASRRPPFRRPHHGSSWSSLVGSASGTFGEITLAHHGVLFLDEIAEFDRRALESLREPIEDGWIDIASSSRRIRLPSRFMLIAAMNPPSTLGEYAHARARARMPSEAILDRFDIWVRMDARDIGRSGTRQAYEPITHVREQIQNARALLVCASQEKKAVSPLEYLNSEAIAILDQLAEKLRLSNRGVTRMARVARSVAALDARSDVTAHDVLEAASYRRVES